MPITVDKKKKAAVDKKKKAAVPATEQPNATATAAVPATEQPKATATAADEEAKIKAGIMSEVPVAKAEDNDKIGSKSHTVAFVAALDDPSRDDVTIKQVNGKDEKFVTGTIVGYRFKALEDMTIPECGAGADLKNNPMSVVNPTGTRQVKAGDTFDLTRFETGMLLSPEEFNGKATGGDKEVTVAYTKPQVKTKEGAVATVSGVRGVPSVSLRAVTGSIKDYEMIDVLTFKVEDRGNGVKRKIKTIVPGFEKWAPLCAEAVRGTASGTSTGAAKNVRNKNAEAFMRIALGKK